MRVDFFLNHTHVFSFCVNFDYNFLQWLVLAIHREDQIETIQESIF